MQLTEAARPSGRQDRFADLAQDSCSADDRQAPGQGAADPAALAARPDACSLTFRSPRPSSACGGFEGLVATARGKHPVPSRTRPLSPAAPMVLRPKTRESRSPPDP